MRTFRERAKRLAALEAEHEAQSTPLDPPYLVFSEEEWAEVLRTNRPIPAGKKIYIYVSPDDWTQAA